MQALLSLAEEFREVALQVLNLGLDEVFQLVNGINFDINLLRPSALVDNIGVVGRSSTIPGKELRILVSRVT